MTPSEYEGTYITYTDGIGITHTGYVVGESDDGKTLYVQSNAEGVPETAWHFSFPADDLEAMTRNT